MRREPRADGGMVSAELALVIPALLLVLACCLSGLGLAVDQLRCVDAARVAARAASRGEPPAEAIDLARRLAPAGAEVTVARPDGETVRVVVRAPARDQLLPGLPAAEGTAVARLEPAVRGAEP